MKKSGSKLNQFLSTRMKKKMATGPAVLADVADPNFKPNISSDRLPATPEAVLQKDMLGDQMKHYAGAKERHAAAAQMSGEMPPKQLGSIGAVGSIKPISAKPITPTAKSEVETTIESPKKLKRYKLADFLQKVRSRQI